jgi:hypothetical protein
MEGSPNQEPLKQSQPTDKAAPDPNTSFDSDAFDQTAMPQKRFSLSGINETIFGLMRPKRKVMDPRLKVLPAAKERKIPSTEEHYNYNPIDGNLLKSPQIIPVGYEIQNGLLIQKKTLIERVRDQINFPVLKSSKSVINGAVLIIFAVGVITIYSELPSNPEIVVGIILTVMASTIIVNNR